MGMLSGFEHIVCENEPLAPYTWFRLGGAAEYFAEPTSLDELQALVQSCRRAELPVRMLGGGSKVLVRDVGVPGVVIRLAAAAFSEIQTSDTLVSAGSGAKLGHVISTAVREGLAGLEPLVGIPGTVGGALRGNAGTEAHDIGQSTERATVMMGNGEIVEHGPDDLRFAYRSSSLDELVILRASFALEPEDRRELTKRMQTLWIVKKSQQPTGNESMGRIFKDPIGLRAASLIEQAGLKSARVGGAELSDKHANFVVVHQGATSEDVIRLVDILRSQVRDRVGVELETDVEFW
ncbi:MAG: UDP-N-acetylmuramate dehydrogenase [Planctomycetes bacterium]|nr:UDP-N-acetylmuramate dehydrogenase [Planctomycetota bacterium]